jgi:Protein kinase domain
MPTLARGERLGPYEILDAIGAGGMGEVYKARDTRLNREVAIKVLPQALAQDAERMARFQREAEVLASLNHPNIAVLYGLEEAGGVRALVMELVDGPTLHDRMTQGPIALDEALPIAEQIAEALEAAHERGVIHRDLKLVPSKHAAKDSSMSGCPFSTAAAYRKTGRLTFGFAGVCGEGAAGAVEGTGVPVLIDKARAADSAGMVTVADTTAVLLISPSRGPVRVMGVPFAGTQSVAADR